MRGNGSGPTGLAVVASSLAAVKPDWLCVIHNDREACSRRRVFCWDETREEAACERVAGIREGRLSDSMVLREEIELDCRADRRSDVVGAVLKNSICSDSDFDSSSRLSIDRCRRNGHETKEGIGELHYGLFAD